MKEKLKNLKKKKRKTMKQMKRSIFQIKIYSYDGWQKIEKHGKVFRSKVRCTCTCILKAYLFGIRERV